MVFETIGRLPNMGKSPSAAGLLTSNNASFGCACTPAFPRRGHCLGRCTFVCQKYTVSPVCVGSLKYNGELHQQSTVHIVLHVPSPLINGPRCETNGNCLMGVPRTESAKRLEGA